MINLEIRALRQKIAERDEDVERLKEEVQASTFDPKVPPKPQTAARVQEPPICLALISSSVSLCRDSDGKSECLTVLLQLLLNKCAAKETKRFYYLLFQTSLRRQWPV